MSDAVSALGSRPPGGSAVIVASVSRVRGSERSVWKTLRSTSASPISSRAWRSAIASTLQCRSKLPSISARSGPAPLSTTLPDLGRRPLQRGLTGPGWRWTPERAVAILLGGALRPTWLCAARRHPAADPRGCDRGRLVQDQYRFLCPAGAGRGDHGRFDGKTPRQSRSPRSDRDRWPEARRGAVSRQHQDVGRLDDAPGPAAPAVDQMTASLHATQGCRLASARETCYCEDPADRIARLTHETVASCCGCSTERKSCREHWRGMGRMRSGQTDRAGRITVRGTWRYGL